jgi:uncharacterized membrane protein YdcZ (DUF606 family)
VAFILSNEIMPNISASDYTTFLKYKAAAASPIQQSIQTRTNATLSQSVLNANILASQAAFVVTPTLTTIRGNARVQAPPLNNVNSPDAKSTLSWTSGTSGSVGSTTSSKFVQPGGLPANNVVGTYTRLPTNAGWIQGNMVSSGPKRF